MSGLLLLPHPQLLLFQPVLPMDEEAQQASIQPFLHLTSSSQKHIFSVLLLCHALFDPYITQEWRMRYDASFYSILLET
jgi:hypothetical protein